MLRYRNRFVLSLIGTMVFASIATLAHSLELAHSPLFLVSPAKPNILAILDNSNSMDEAPDGSAVGSDAPESKSEIAHNAVEAFIDVYMNSINLGLMAYQQAGIGLRQIHNATYDSSYDSANYDAAFDGPRDSTTKRHQIPNPSSEGDFVYYNVALPFYSAANEGNAFCYSTTADASNDFNNGEDPDTGPWDTYRCFTGKSGSSDTIPVWENGASETLAGYSGFWFQADLRPTDSDFAQGLLDFGHFLTWQHVGPTWFANSSPGRGYLHVPIKDLDASQKSALDTKLGTSQFAVNLPTDPARPFQNAGLTPIEGTLLTALDYFEGDLSEASEGFAAGVYPLPESCGKDFVMLATDGLPSTDPDGNSVSDPAQAITDAASAASALLAAGVETYVIGFALPYGVDPATLDTIAVAGGTDAAYSADSPPSLGAAFDAILSNIIDKTGSAASAATSSTSLMSGTKVFQARFDSTDWSGQLLEFDIDLAGNIGATANWDAGAVINGQTPSSREIITFSRDTSDGMPFTFADIAGQSDTTQRDYLDQDGFGTTDGLGSDRVDFLRGVAVTGFRDRSSKLGDIVHSSPMFVGAPRAGHLDASYASFAASHTSRTPMLYVGANDGMLHGFDAGTGTEKIGYVPGAVYRNLSRLTHPSYGQAALPHRYYVDGSPMVADAKLGSDWKTLLAGGLDGGGQGYYAMDVTDPSSFEEANAADLVLWEFTDEDDQDLGYTFNQPPVDPETQQSRQIVKTNNGQWGLIIGNGYENTEADGHASATGHALLFVLFFAAGADGSWGSDDYAKIDTSAGSVPSPNGLATPATLDIDGDGDIDLAYAGDLEGNLWKFDLTHGDPTNWTVGKLFTAVDASDNAQPITTAPLVMPHPDGGYMVGFGTGQYLEQADLTTTDTHTFYGIWDNEPGGGVSTVTGGGGNVRTVLQEQTVLDVVIVGDYAYRITTDDAVDYSTKRGWFMDLPDSGERVSYSPIARDGRFVFVTSIPDLSDPCAGGGTGWLMELDYLNGSRLDESPFDVNGDHAISDLDLISYTSGDDTELVPASGIKSVIGIPTTPTVLDKDEQTEIKVLNGTNSGMGTLTEGKSVPSGRLSWRQIIDE